RMKSLQLAVVLLIVCISSALALKCNRCVPAGGGTSCSNRVETCDRANDVCVSVTYFSYRYFKRCMKRADAEILKADPSFNVYICTTDRCN
uniref:UPAR/Ly6 domain-containing protein n=1 Tax=Anabas testudineus TaxID=64144 RepID=A0A3Q1JA05_ANATE